MCGIVGLLLTKPAAPHALEALRRLEYRGYDSAGIATLADGTIMRTRAEGKLGNLQARLEAEPLSGSAAIGHTRWATHGAATEDNAHPHATSRVAVVHNGIIENYRELRGGLEARGISFESETDTEVVTHLIDLELAAGQEPVEAVRRTLGRLEGAFALAIMFAGHADLLIGARRGSPLAVGHGDGEMYLGSDAIALAPFTNRITYLDEGDWAVLSRAGVQIRDAAGNAVERPTVTSNASAFLVDKAGHRHFMAKEIFEQPDVLSHTLARYLDIGSGTVRLPSPAPLPWQDISRLNIASCGTAYLAGLTARSWFENLAGLPVDIDVASEFRYREPPLDPRSLSLFISQSGETADTLASLRYCRLNAQKTAAVVNVQESTIARESDVIWPLLVGPEIGVASTKAFTAQLAVLACLALDAARSRGMLQAGEERRLTAALASVPRLLAAALQSEPDVQRIARHLAQADSVLYLGRGPSHAIALEGALKLKELSYIHAEGYPAGELKHGPIALVDSRTPVIAVAPGDSLFAKTLSNIQEVVARGGNVIAITDSAGSRQLQGIAQDYIVLPDCDPFVQPIISAVPVQLLAYHTAVHMGTDVDQPRNLAKSVTVE